MFKFARLVISIKLDRFGRLYLKKAKFLKFKKIKLNFSKSLTFSLRPIAKGCSITMFKKYLKLKLKDCILKNYFTEYI